MSCIENISKQNAATRTVGNSLPQKSRNLLKVLIING